MKKCIKEWNHNIFLKAIFVLCFFCITGCGGLKYYRNDGYVGDIQAQLNRDLAYCDAIARGITPEQAIYIPQSQITTHRRIRIIDSRGNAYSSSYSHTTYPNQTVEALKTITSIANSMEASKRYSTIKNMCINELGWYEVTKEEHEILMSTQENVSQANKNISDMYTQIDSIDKHVSDLYTDKYFNQKMGKVTATFTSSPSGAVVYWRSNAVRLTYIEYENEKTPFIVNIINKEMCWPAMCYKAKMNGKESKEICFSECDKERSVHFDF